MACDPAALLQQAKCIMTCIPAGMVPSVTAVLLCQLAQIGLGDPPSFVQGVASGFNGPDTVATTAAITTTSGNLFVIFVANQTNAGPLDALVSDNKGNVFTQIGTRQDDVFGGFPVSGSMFYCANAIGGAGHTFTVAGNFPSIVVVEIAGATTLNASAQGQDGSSPYTMAVTPTVAKTIIVSAGFSDTGDNPVIFADSGATVRASVSNGLAFWAPAISTKTTGPIVAHQSSWTFSGSTEAIIFSAVFK